MRIIQKPPIFRRLLIKNRLHLLFFKVCLGIIVVFAVLFSPYYIYTQSALRAALVVFGSRGSVAGQPPMPHIALYFTANAIASATVCASSFLKMFLRCVATVFSDIPKRSATDWTASP